MSEQDADDAGPDEVEEAAGDRGDRDTGETQRVEPEGGAPAAFADPLSDLDPDITEIEPDPEVVERVEDADAETVATQLSALRTRIEALESQLEKRENELDDLESRLARKQADFQNYKKRQAERLEEEKQRATEDLVGRLLDVRDNLARALDQDDDADIRGGVESTLRQFDGELERENVAPIEPEPGDDVDPERHEVLVRVESDRPEGTIADVHRPGYEMAGKVLRAAQVTVSEGEPSVGAAEQEAAGEDNDDAAGPDEDDGDA